MRWRLLGCLLLLGQAGLVVASTLEVRAQPGVEVYWEGVLLDETDARGNLTVEDIPEGLFELQLRKTGFRTLTAEVRVRGESTLLERRLAKLPSGEIEEDADFGAGNAVDRETSSSDPATAELQRSSATQTAQPSVKLSTGGWLMLVALLGMGGVFALRSLRVRQVMTEPEATPERPVAAAVPAEPASVPPPSVAGEGDSFLDDLQQRERTWSEEGNLAATGDASDETDVVDVAWKEVD